MEDTKLAQQHYQKALTLERQGKHNEAIKEYHACLKHNFDDVMAIYRLGSSFLKQGKFELAIVYLTKAVEINPKLYGAWNDLGFCHMEMGNNYEAEQMFEKSLQHHNNQPDIKRLLKKLVGLNIF